MLKQFFLILVTCYFCALPAEALTLPGDGAGPKMIPSTATATFIEAGSICDRQRNNLNEYLLIYEINNPLCPGQAIYLRKGSTFYDAIPHLKILLPALISLVSLSLLIIVFAIYNQRKKIWKLLQIRLF